MNLAGWEAEYESLADTEQGLRRFMTRYWKQLPGKRRQTVADYCDRKGYGKKRSQVLRDLAIMGEVDGRRRTIENYIEELAQADLAKQQETAAAQERKKARCEEWEQKKARALEYLARGEWIPAQYRGKAGWCIFCESKLKDPVSVRWGIGPVCMKSALTAGTVPKAVYDRYRRDRAELDSEKRASSYLD